MARTWNALSLFFRSKSGELFSTFMLSYWATELRLLRDEAAARRALSMASLAMATADDAWPIEDVSSMLDGRLEHY